MHAHVFVERVHVSARNLSPSVSSLHPSCPIPGPIPRCHCGCPGTFLPVSRVINVRVHVLPPLLRHVRPRVPRHPCPCPALAGGCPASRLPLPPLFLRSSPSFFPCSR